MTADGVIVSLDKEDEKEAPSENRPPTNEPDGS
ncbi:hypothetical protein DSM3645_13153 [Blastopirellula marina DSM 3645]|uniref:Uncharacterized protein n=1 Tax=Blastopirellula marina DSM 3645 TaxID=314230 RepID=A4A203_9BACT|nr:hypothetical protein DSM3645_13153 [Blastopirellula marina DSM 3645]